MIGLEVLALAAYGLAFLAADAHIFGADTNTYKNKLRFQPWAIQKQMGILPLRPLLLRLHFFYELLQCYFCVGVWTGAGAHALLNNLYGSRYVLYHDPTWQGWLQGMVVAILWSAPAVYVLDLVVKLLEKNLEEST